jgi:hypothetical protein
MATGPCLAGFAGTHFYIYLGGRVPRLLRGSFHLLPACPFPSRARYSAFASSEFPKFYSLSNDFTHFPPTPAPTRVEDDGRDIPRKQQNTTCHLLLHLQIPLLIALHDGTHISCLLRSPQCGLFRSGRRTFHFFCLLHLLFLYHGSKVRAPCIQGL